jgi:hypothetical protein
MSMQIGRTVALRFWGHTSRSWWCLDRDDLHEMKVIAASVSEVQACLDRCLCSARAPLLGLTPKILNSLNCTATVLLSSGSSSADT